MLVTTLTKRMAEDLTEYYAELGVRVRYLHSDIDTLERIAILRDLRLGEFDVLVGINLLREGLDLPEVSLVAILDADKEGFLRAERSLIQTIGRAARNVHGRVIMYADRETDSMKKAISETRRRRALQEAYNTEHGITPTTIQKAMQDLAGTAQDDFVDPAKVKRPRRRARRRSPPQELPGLIGKLKQEMFDLAEPLEFEKAADRPRPDQGPGTAGARHDRSVNVEPRRTSLTLTLSLAAGEVGNHLRGPGRDRLTNGVCPRPRAGEGQGEGPATSPLKPSGIPAARPSSPRWRTADRGANSRRTDSPSGSSRASRRLTNRRGASHSSAVIDSSARSKMSVLT